MTGSPHRGSPYDPSWPSYYPPETDPAYAGSSPYGPTYAAVSPPTTTYQPTEPLSQYWTQTSAVLPPPGQPPPEPPRSPRVLWLALGAAVVLLVAGLIIALVIVDSSSKRQTAVAPLPAMPSPSSLTTTPSAPTTTRPPIRIPVPLPTPPPTSGEPNNPGETEPVVYEVTGHGRVISITYVDNNTMQSEFNVMLPWHREVDLPKPAADEASVMVINVGRDITCTITISGVQVRTQTGAGLIMCSPGGLR